MKRYLEYTDEQFEALNPQAQEAILRMEREQTAQALHERGHQEKSSFSCKRIKTEEEFQKEVSSHIRRDGRTIAPDLLHRDKKVPWRKQEGSP